MHTSLLYNNIPNELKQLKQWVICNDTETKVLLNPHTGKPASVTNPNSWGSYLDCLNTNSKHIGFVFTKDDPYVVIDLDDKPHDPATPEQRKRFEHIINTFDTYSEISQSGFGVHLICKGPIFSGHRREHVELYSKDRYVIITGNLLGNAKPIADRSELVSILHKELGPVAGSTPLLWLPATMPDNEVLRMAGEARNGSGSKFQALWRADPAIIAELNQGTGGQSEADNSLLSLLAFYSQSDEQVIRLFRQSGLGQRDKAYRDDYVHNGLSKIRASFYKPPVDFTELDANLRKAQKKAIKPTIDFPKGLVGDIAQYIFDTSKRPVKEISLTASMALVTSIVQRAYNVSHTGLNQYFILIAGTGRGKEEGRKGIKRIIKACRSQLMMLDTVSIVDDFVGSSGFESGQGLVRNIADKPCSLSMLGEFGDTLAEMTSSRVNPNVKRISTVLRDVYHQSGHTDSFIGSAYADMAKNVKDVKSPNLTIYAEGAIETFFEAIDPSQIANGLLPRFLILEYSGKRGYSQNVTDIDVPQNIIDRLKDLYLSVYATMKNENVCEVKLDKDAEALLGNAGYYDNHTTDLINDGVGASISELWNRSHLKAMKIAAVLAVCDNYIDPCINKEQAEWAINLTTVTTQNLISKFDSGEISFGDTKQDSDFKKAFLGYLEMSPRKRRSTYNIGDELSHHQQAVPYTALKNNLRRRSSFVNDRRGATAALDTVINRFIKDQMIIQVPVDQAKLELGTSCVVYIMGPEWNTN